MVIQQPVGIPITQFADPSSDSLVKGWLFNTPRTRSPPVIVPYFASTINEENPTNF